MERQIAMEMYKTTNENGRLIIRGWPVDEESDAGGCFVRCQMNWDDDIFYCEDVIGDLMISLDLIGTSYLKKTAEFGERPVFEPMGDEFDEEEVTQMQQKAMSLWEDMFLDFEREGMSIDEVSDEACRRFGFKKYGYNPYTRMRRVLKLYEYDAPAIILKEEKYQLAVSYVLGLFCEDMDYADILTDDYDYEEGRIGCFSHSDLCEILDMLEIDRALMPEEWVGFTMLMCAVFGSNALFMGRFYDKLKPLLDELLGTLTSNEREILKARFGLEGGVRKRADEIALEKKRRTFEIDFYERNALRKLKHPSRSRKIMKAIEGGNNNE